MATTGFSKEERAAMKERAKELKAEQTREAGMTDVQNKIAEMTDDEKAIARKILDIVADVAPDLMPRTYYGMPAWARDGKNIIFFQPASKFGVRYSTIGFEQAANLDDGDLWPTSYAVLSIGAAEEKRIRALLTQAIS